MRISFTKLFTSNPRRWLLFTGLLGLIFSLSFTNVLYAQTKTISGTVTSADDESVLPGVNVIVKGTTIGTVTDIEGNYRLNVPEDATALTFSFIGFAEKEMEIGTQSVVNVTMDADIQQLSEVVVTALGIERNKNELPYAAQKVEGEEITKTRNVNAINSLAGKVAGLNIKSNNSMGGSSNVIIRGNTSLTGNNQALFVVDGVPIDNSNTNSNGSVDPTRNQQSGRGGYDYGNAAADINPDDIASINILKGAAATALYGSRAANGAIIITTKKGRKGLGVTINSGVTVGIVDKSTFPTFQKQYGAGYGQYYESPDGYFLYRDINGDGVDDLVTPTSEDASHGGPFDPSLLVYQWDAFDPTSPYYQKPRPWVAAANDPSEFFNKSVNINNSFIIDGGNDIATFKLGYTRNDEKGILPNSELDKNLVNFGATFNITDKLKASASVNMSSIKGLGRYGTGYDSKNLMTNFRQWWQTNVDIKELEEAYNRSGKNVTWNWADPTDLKPIYWDNPYWTRYENYQNDSRMRYFGYASLSYEITDWLNVMGRVSIDSYNELQEERIAVGSVDPSKYSRYNRAFREYNYDLLINFNKDLGESFSLQGLLGSNIRKTEIESIYAETNGGLVVPRLYSISNSLNQIEAPAENYSQLEVDGFFASVTLGYKDFLFLDATGRRDQSSSLPDGNNVYYYPSISGSFVFSKLLGTGLPWMSYGKLRANYAEVGNTAPVQSISDVYTKPTPFGTSPLFSIPGTKNNPDLKPERTKSAEIGLEMAFFENRVGFDLSLYKQNTVDQILPVEVSRATGYNFKYVNAGDVENKGIEVTAFATPLQTKDFSWKVNVNWAKNVNRVVKLFEGVDNLQLASFQGGVSINAALGEPYGTIRGSDFQYNENGQKMVNSDPTSSTYGYYLQSVDANKVIGDSNPDWLGGINNTLTYKGISLGFLVDMRFGGDVFILDQYYGLATGIYPETAGLNSLGNPVRDPLIVDENGIPDPASGGVLLEGVKEDGSANDIWVSASNYGTFGYRRTPAAGFVYDASFVKLREASITYSFPKSLIESTPFEGIDISLIGRNLWIIHKNTPYSDPEEGISSGNAQGYQGGSYPTTRNIGFNVRLRF